VKCIWTSYAFDLIVDPFSFTSWRLQEHGKSTLIIIKKKQKIIEGFLNFSMIIQQNIYIYIYIYFKIVGSL
jgi:hypothetical protein